MKELLEFEFQRKRGKRSKYEWDKILNGKTWELTRGEDYSPEPQTFIAHIHGTAKRRGLKVQTHRQGEVIIVCAYDEMDAASALSV